MSNTNAGKTIKYILIGTLVFVFLSGAYILVKNITKKEKYPKVKMMPLPNPITEITIDGIPYEVPDGYTIIETENGFYGYGEMAIITETDIEKDLMDDKAYIINGETYRVYPVTKTLEVKEKGKELTKSE